MKDEKEIKEKLEQVKKGFLNFTRRTEYYKIEQQAKILEWVLTDEPKFKIGDEIVYKNNGCEFLGTISLVAENNHYFVRFNNCIVNELCLDESVLVKLVYKRLYSFKNK
jgi:hypothetical protein